MEANYKKEATEYVSCARTLPVDDTDIGDG